MSNKILDEINSVADLKALPADKLPELCEELRAFLIEKVSSNGGHLASNLGVIELTLAMHRAFDAPKDHIIFDVGHQAYVHKILTGRKSQFDNLRKPGGLSGFTVMRESEYDCFGAGHSSTSVSAALGFAESDKIKGIDATTVCLIGDGAYTGGMVHEALNNCKTDLPLVIILNENGMSISNNKGTFASYLSGVRVSERYNKWKRYANSVIAKIPLIGKPVLKFFGWIKEGIKRLVYTSNYFEDLGFYYMGPIDGHNIKRLEKAFGEAKRLGKCVVIHVKTQKGRGYEPAERFPDEYHSVSSKKSADSYHSVATEQIIELAKSDDDIVAVTAAMGIGTGLDSFGQTYPHRYFDVGIAEEHALTFSAGLAAAGMKPYVAIYSTFLQRGYDNIVHDIALQSLPVKILIDRAGLSVADGATHHGIFDVSFLSHVPGMQIISPATYGSLKAALKYSQTVNTPIAIRYNNASEDCEIVDAFYNNADYENFGVRCDFDISNVPKRIFIAYGHTVKFALEAKKLLGERENLDIGVILVEKLKPYQEPVAAIANIIKKAKCVIYAEEGVKNGGSAMITLTELKKLGFDFNATKFDICAIDDDFVIPSALTDIYSYAGISAECLAKKMTLLEEKI